MRRRLKLNSYHPYIDSLLHPETVLSVKNPSGSYETCNLFRHISYQVTANENGCCAIIFNPFSLLDNTFGATNSSFLVNTSPEYNGKDVLTGLTPTSISYSVTPQTVNTYRLVSASFWMVPTNPSLYQNGTIYAGVIPIVCDSYATNASFNATSLLALATKVSNFTNYGSTQCEAQASMGQGIRLTWRPLDNKDSDFWSVNKENDVTNYYNDNCFVALVQGALSNNTSFVVEMYLNYELTPWAGSIISGMTSQNTLPGDALQLAKECTIYSNQAEVIGPDSAIQFKNEPRLKIESVGRTQPQPIIMPRNRRDLDAFLGVEERELNSVFGGEL
jgi:hypothetical protein